MKTGLPKVFILILGLCLVISFVFNGYFFWKLTKTDQQVHHSMFFSFVFGPTMQNITRDNLYVNMTFDVVEGNLTVKTEVNTESYNPDAVLALQFDSDNNGTIDIRYSPEDSTYAYYFGQDDSQFLLRTDNNTTPSRSEYWGWLPDGTIYFSRILPSGYPYLQRSPFHSCLFNNGTYTLLFTFPMKLTHFNSGYPYGWLDGIHGTESELPGIQGKLVRVLYGIEPEPSMEEPEKGMTVCVPPFDFTG